MQWQGQLSRVLHIPHAGYGDGVWGKGSKPSGLLPWQRRDLGRRLGVSGLSQMAGECVQAYLSHKTCAHLHRYKSGAGGQKTREALLDPKSHRRVSRRQVRVHSLGSVLYSAHPMTSTCAAMQVTELIIAAISDNPGCVAPIVPMTPVASVHPSSMRLKATAGPGHAS